MTDENKPGNDKPDEVKPIGATTLELMTFDSLNRTIQLYKESKDDNQKIYQITNAINILDGLRVFLMDKRDLLLQLNSEKRANIAKMGNVDINVTQNVGKPNGDNKK